MLKKVINLLVLLSVIGLCCTIFIHIAAVIELTFNHYDKVFYLLKGLFIVGVPTILISTPLLNKDSEKKSFLKSAFADGPLWVNILLYVSFGYAFFNLAYMMYIGNPMLNGISMARFISGHLLPFYSGLLATLLTSLRYVPK